MKVKKEEEATKEKSLCPSSLIGSWLVKPWVKEQLDQNYIGNSTCHLSPTSCLKWGHSVGQCSGRMTQNDLPLHRGSCPRWQRPHLQKKKESNTYDNHKMYKYCFRNTINVGLSIHDANSPVRGSFMGRQAVHWFWCGSYLSMLDRCDTPLCPPTTNMKPSMTPTPKLILLSAMGATISQASLLGSYRSTLGNEDTEILT